MLDGRGSQRATWGHLGPGHLGAQGASVVRVVDYCNEQIHPNPPEKSQITTCSKAKAMAPRVRPVPLLLVSGRGAECRHCCAFVWLCPEAQGVLGDCQCCSTPARCWGGGLCLGGAGMPPVSSAAAAGLAGRLCRAAGAARLLPARLKGSTGPRAFHLGFSLAYA